MIRATGEAGVLMKEMVWARWGDVTVFTVLYTDDLHIKGFAVSTVNCNKWEPHPTAVYCMDIQLLF